MPVGGIMTCVYHSALIGQNLDFAFLPEFLGTFWRIEYVPKSCKYMIYHGHYHQMFNKTDGLACISGTHFRDMHFRKSGVPVILVWYMLYTHW